MKYFSLFLLILLIFCFSIHDVSAHGTFTEPGSGLAWQDAWTKIK